MTIKLEKSVDIVSELDAIKRLNRLWNQQDEECRAMATIHHENIVAGVYDTTDLEAAHQRFAEWNGLPIPL